MAKVQFFKGTYANYSKLTEEQKAIGIYFSTDKPIVFAAGQEIGGVDGSIVSTFEWVDASNALKVSYRDGSEQYVVIPLATAEKNGLMSKEDYAKLASIDVSVFAKIADVSANFIAKTDSSLFTKEEKEKLAGIEAEAQKNVIEGVQVNGTDLTPDANKKVNVEVPVIGIADNDKVLSLSDKKLSTTLSLVYDASTRKVQLLGKDSSVISEFDAGDFVKDGMLYGTAIGKASDSGEVTVIVKDQSHTFTGCTPGHQYLAFCFTDGAATPEFTWQCVDVDTLVDVYTAGTAIEIDATQSNKISVKVGEDTSTNKNFLDVEDNSLTVREVDADCTMTVKDVEVNGGPLASQVTNWPWTDESGKKIVPANLSMQDFIEGLYLKVINGALGTPSYSWNPVNTAPSASIGVSGAVEVGTEVTITFSASQNVTGNTHSVSVDANSSGMYGYYDTTAHANADYIQSVACSTEGTATATATWNAESVETGAKKNVVIGTNTLSVSQSGITAKCVDLTPITIYALTNTGVKVDSVSRSITADSRSDKALAPTNSASCTGVWPVYYGLDTAPTKATIKNDTVWEGLDITESGTSRASFAYPASGSRTITVKVYNSLNKSYEAYAGEYEITDITKTINGVDYDYKLWKRVSENSNGSNKYQITLSKKTSE